MSSEHSTVDGTLIDARASLTSFQPKDAGQKERNERKRSRKDRRKPKGGGGAGSNTDVNFRGERRSNATHESSTDPDARLARKGDGKEAKLSFSAHVVIDAQVGYVVDTYATRFAVGFTHASVAGIPDNAAFAGLQLQK